MSTESNTTRLAADRYSRLLTPAPLGGLFRDTAAPGHPPDNRLVIDHGRAVVADARRMLVIH